MSEDSDFLQQLTAADPIDIDTIPGPESAPAQALLNATVNADAGHHGQQVQGAAVQSRSAVTQIQSRRSLGRSRGMLVSAAAAVLLMVGGLLVFSPNNTPSAVATVHSAAAAVDADSGRIATTFALAEDGVDAEAPEQFAGRFDAAYSGSDVAFSVGLEDSSDMDFGDGEMPFNEVRLIDGVLYVNEGDNWWSIDTDGIFGQIVADFVDPRVVLEKVQELTEATEVGETTIDGQTVTHYRSVVDLGDETLSQSGWLGFEIGQFDGEGEVTVDMYVGEGELLSQLDLSGNVAEAPAEGSESGTFEVSMRFFDIGTDINIEVPADAAAFDPAAMLGDEGLSGFGQELDG